MSEPLLQGVLVTTILLSLLAGLGGWLARTAEQRSQSWLILGAATAVVLSAAGRRVASGSDLDWLAWTILGILILRAAGHWRRDPASGSGRRTTTRPVTTARRSAPQ